MPAPENRKRNEDEEEKGKICPLQRNECFAAMKFNSFVDTLIPHSQCDVLHLGCEKMVCNCSRLTDYENMLAFMY